MLYFTGIPLHRDSTSQGFHLDTLLEYMALGFNKFYMALGTLQLNDSSILPILPDEQCVKTPVAWWWVQGYEPFFCQLIYHRDYDNPWTGNPILNQPVFIHRLKKAINLPWKIIWGWENTWVARWVYHIPNDICMACNVSTAVMNHQYGLSIWGCWILLSFTNLNDISSR